MLAPINVKVAQRRHPYALLPPGGGSRSRKRSRRFSYLPHPWGRLRDCRIHHIPVDQGGAKRRMRERVCSERLS
jgi:hypothetical protein